MNSTKPFTQFDNEFITNTTKRIYHFISTQIPETIMAHNNTIYIVDYANMHKNNVSLGIDIDMLDPSVFYIIVCNNILFKHANLNVGDILYFGDNYMLVITEAGSETDDALIINLFQVNWFADLKMFIYTKDNYFKIKPPYGVDGQLSIYERCVKHFGPLYNNAYTSEKASLMWDNMILEFPINLYYMDIQRNWPRLLMQPIYGSASRIIYKSEKEKYIII
jgi:hypothetical protein